jgi:SAM-dependent methyltransferase
MKRDTKFYAMLQRSSDLQHSLSYARGYREQDNQSKDEVSHAGKCEIIRKLSDSFRYPAVVLDLGCGTGRYFHCVKNVRLLVGVDPSENMLRMTKDPVEFPRSGVQLLRASLHTIEFKPETFDMVICVGVFGAVCPLDEFSLTQIAKFLKPNGLLFFTISEYLPTYKTWKAQIAEVIEPFLFGDPKRYVKLRLRRFSLSANQVKHLISNSYCDPDICQWKSPTGRIDLHCIVKKKSIAHFSNHESESV